MVKARLPGHGDRFTRHHHRVIDSTMNEARRLAEAGAPSFTIVQADTQTAGRGRRGRAWHSPPGNLLLSCLVRPAIAPQRAGELSFLVPLAIGDSLASLLGLTGETRWPAGAGPGPLLYKWPNDVLLGGRKVAGVLLEAGAATAAGVVPDVIIGIGINLGHMPAESRIPAISVQAWMAEMGPGPGVALEPAELLERLLADLARWYDLWAVSGFEPIRTEWKRSAHRLGKTVTVTPSAGQALQGRFVDLDPTGAMVLLVEGRKHLVTVGDVS